MPIARPIIVTTLLKRFDTGRASASRNASAERDGGGRESHEKRQSGRDQGAERHHQNDEGQGQCALLGVVAARGAPGVHVEIRRGTAGDRDPRMGIEPLRARRAAARPLRAPAPPRAARASLSAETRPTSSVVTWPSAERICGIVRAAHNPRRARTAGSAPSARRGVLQPTSG